MLIEEPEPILKYTFEFEVEETTRRGRS